MQGSDIDKLIERGKSELATPAREFAEGGYAIEGEDLDSSGQPMPDPNVRTFEYRGHTVSITTHYEITIDGETWRQNLHVLKNGTLHYHAMPQANLPSAVDLMKAVIDTGYEAPEEIRKARAGS